MEQDARQGEQVECGVGGASGGGFVKARKAAGGIYSIVDPASPWKLPSSYAGFPKYKLKMAAAELRDLFAKAEEGHSEAEFGVATLYADGCRDRRGRVLVRCSASKAAEWYRRSAEHGCVSAQNTLGVILGGNYGVKKDRRAALMWLKRAFSGGDTCCAPNNIAITYREGGNFRQAFRWFRKAATLGDGGVFVQLGIHYYWGRGVRTDHQEAIRYFRKATRGKSCSESDRDDANFYIGVAYLEGKGVAKSPRMARIYLERANRDDDHLAAKRVLYQLRGLV